MVLCWPPHYGRHLGVRWIVGILERDRKIMKNGTFDSMSREVLREADLGPTKLEFFDDFGYRKLGM